MANQTATIQLTSGNPLKQLLRFSAPLVIGSLFQQLYSFADTIMVGRLISENALAAVGTTYSLNFLTLGFVQGICIGFGIPLAQQVGAENSQELKRYLWNGIWLCLFLGTIITAGTFALAPLLLQNIKTPETIFSDALCYIRIIFLGIPASILYNFCAGALRATGDSRHPTFFLLASSFINIILDYLFIVPFSMGVSGAALATVFSLFLSGLMNLAWILRKTDLLNDSVGLRRVSGNHISRLCKIGFPMGFEYSISAIGAIVMQSAINTLGTAAIAGQTTGEKIRQMFTLPMESVGMGMATYAGQNDGAKRYDRIWEGIKSGITIQLVYCAAAWIVIFFGKGFFTKIVLGTSSSQAALLSVQYLGSISTLFCIHGSLMILRNTLQGMGYSIHAVVSGIGELLGRSVGAWLSVVSFGFTGICYANPIAWGFALTYCSLLVSYFLRQRIKGEIPKQKV